MSMFPETKPNVDKTIDAARLEACATNFVVRHKSGGIFSRKGAKLAKVFPGIVCVLCVFA
jgi:hypothetical protein